MPQQGGPIGARTDSPPRWAQWLVVAVTFVAVAASLASSLGTKDDSCNFCLGCTTHTSGNTPLGTAPLALGSPEAGGGPNNRSYAMELLSNYPNTTWNEVRFFVTNDSGTKVTPGSNWSVTILPYPRQPWASVASYDLVTQTWVFGGASIMPGAANVILELGSSNLTARGYTFSISGFAPCPGFQGTATIA